MNKLFLERFREKPHPEFVQHLYRRLQENERREGYRPPGKKRFVQGLTALTIVLMLTMMVLPGALAGPVGMNVHTLPGLTFREVERQPNTLILHTNPLIKTVTVTDLQEARRIAGFTIDVPNWIPENFVMQRMVSMVGLQDNHGADRMAVFGQEIYVQPYAVQVTWRDTLSPRRIQMWVVKHGHQFDGLPSLVVGRGSYQDYWVDIYPGAVVQGQWNPQTHHWDPTHGGYLVWVQPDVDCFLVVDNGRLPMDSLIRMAESIKE